MVPGGKWLAEINRIVRVEIGAWSLEKKAALMARDTAT